MKTRKFVLAVAALSVASLVGPLGVASAKTSKVTLKADSTLKGNKLPGTASGTFGKGKVNGTVNIPKATSVLTFKFKGGTLTVSSKTPKIVGTVGSGTWKVTKGTGKFKGAKGGGKQTGDIVTADFVFKGKVTY